MHNSQPTYNVKSPLKILYVITSLRTGGAEKLVMNLALRLKEKGHTIEIYSLDGTETDISRQLIDKGIKIHSGAKGLYNVWNPRHYFHIGKLAKENRYDIIHSHNTAAQLFLSFSKAKNFSAIVTTEHNTHNRRRNKRWLDKLDGKIYSNYQSVICVSDSVKKNLVSYLSAITVNRFHDLKKRIVTIPNGVDLQKFGRPIESGVKSKGEDSDKVILLMPAAFRKQKDHATLIKAISQLPPRYELWLAGEGETMGSCKNLAGKLEISDRIKFLGNVDNIHDLISQSYLVILSSHYEGLSMALLESMAMGKVCLLSNVDGLRDISPDQNLLFEEGDYQGLASLILTLTSDKQLYNDLSRKCELKGQFFDIEKTIENHETLYHELKQNKDNRF